MSGPVFTLAVWDIAAHRWAALATSASREKVEALHVQLTSLVMVFAEVVEVVRDDDEAIVATLSMLPKVHPEAAFRSHLDLCEWMCGPQAAALVGRPARSN